MRKFRGLLLLIMIAALAAGGWYYDVARRTRLGEQALAATGLEFLPFDQALARARAEHRPVLADFSAIWCPTCRALHQTVFANPQVQALIRSRYVLSRIDYESAEAPAFMQRYAVTGFPSLLVIDADGQLLRHLPVSLDPPTFLVALEG